MFSVHVWSQCGHVWMVDWFWLDSIFQSGLLVWLEWCEVRIVGLGCYFEVCD